MLDLGTSFLASVERDREALAIIDGPVRLTYRAWYAKISALVAAFDEIGLKPGDHLVTVLQNRWEAATLHWACQFAGIIITPLNWRATSEELDFCIEDADARAIVYQDVSAASGSRRKARPIPAAHCGRGGGFGRPRFCPLGRKQRRRRNAARRRASLVADALYLRHHLAAEGRAPPPSRRAGGRDRACGAEPLRPGRTHARSDAALPHHGGSLAAGDVADRRHVRVPAAVRRPGRRSISSPPSKSRISIWCRRSTTISCIIRCSLRPKSARCANSASPERR